MKRLLVLGLLIIGIGCFSPDLLAWPRKGGYSSGGSVSVRGYTRRDGTYVRPHTRSAPGRSYLPYVVPAAAATAAVIASRPAQASPSSPSIQPLQFAAPDSSAVESGGSSPPISVPAPASASQPVAIPPVQLKTTINECGNKGWCYITINPDGTQEFRANPATNIAYPPAPGVTLPRMVIVNNQ